MKTLLTILTIFISSAIYSQIVTRQLYALTKPSDTVIWVRPMIDDSIRVKIIKIRGNQVVMKTLERPRVKLMTFCKCPYRKGEKVWIKKP